MLRERTPVSTLILLTLIIGSLFVGCARPANEVKRPEPERRAESTPLPPPQNSQFAQALMSPTPTAAKPTPLPPPRIDQIGDAVGRVFEKAATPDPAASPGFVLGDFNGDGSEDLAVVVKATNGSLSEINNELANWILEDPRKVIINTTVATTQMPPAKPARAEKGDTLLAIIHGVGAQGWRAPEAKQTFLLKNGAGSNLRVDSANTLRKAYGKQRLPQLKGDAISETIGAKSGLVFWTGAKYAWYPSAPN